MNRTLLFRVLRALLPIAFFATVAWLLKDELAALEVDKIVESLGQISAVQLVLAAAFAIAGYAVLASFDVLARAYVGHPLSLRTTIAISFVSYAFNFNIGGIAGAVGFRYRLYSKRGLRASKIASITLFSIFASWAGWLVLLGLCFLVRPGLVPTTWGLSRILLRALAVLFLGLPALYLWACAGRRRAFRIGRWVYRLPDRRLAVAQVLLGSTYWLCPAAVLWTLQPQARSAEFVPILASYLLAAMAGLVLHVPAGLGVFEAVFLQTLKRALDSDRIVAMLLAYRSLYLLVPLLVATIGLAALEWRARQVAGALNSSRPDSRTRTTRETLRP
jgi:uncharacterized membrane protein YbhN (UPF0104 family)